MCCCVVRVEWLRPSLSLHILSAWRIVTSLPSPSFCPNIYVPCPGAPRKSTALVNTSHQTTGQCHNTPFPSHFSSHLLLVLRPGCNPNSTNCNKAQLCKLRVWGTSCSNMLQYLPETCPQSEPCQAQGPRMSTYTLIVGAPGATEASPRLGARSSTTSVRRRDLLVVFTARWLRIVGAVHRCSPGQADGFLTTPAIFFHNEDVLGAPAFKFVLQSSKFLACSCRRA